MIWNGLFLLVLLICLEASGQGGQMNQQQENNLQNKRRFNTKQRQLNGRMNDGSYKGQILSPAAQEMQNVQQQIEQVTANSDKLNAESKEINAQIKRLDDICNAKTYELKQKIAAMTATYDKNRQILRGISRNIQIEEVEQIRLEGVLKILSEILEIAREQYLIVQSNLQLQEFRRMNGTTENCVDVVQLMAKGEIMTRSRRRVNPFRKIAPKNSDQHKLVLARTKLDTTILLQNQLLKRIDADKKNLNNKNSECERKIQNLKAEIQELIRSMATLEKSIRHFEKNLEEAMKFTKSLRITIKTAKQYIQKVTESTSIMKKAMENFKEDEACFQKVKAMP